MKIRTVDISDAPIVAELSEQLGYPVAAREMEKRIRHVSDSHHRTVLVACLEDRVVAWIDVCITSHLQSGDYAEIGGLVVEASARNLGIGRKLVAAAESWALDRGIQVMVVRSQIKRERAHTFYLREGYELLKTSAVFRKTLE